MSLQSKLNRIRRVARERQGEKFTSLYHHICNPELLRWAFFEVKKQSAAGVDGVTWWEYRQKLEENLAQLSSRLRRGAYRTQPVKRVYIPKSDGSKRALGLPVLEDKIVQRATVEVLDKIYEQDFLGFSYGFRPGRGPHKALDALYVALERHRVNFVLDADIRGFFDAIDHEWLIRFIEHRVGDARVVRLIKKWLNAGVLQQGRVEKQSRGTPQGGVISPLLANIYLHYVLDLWTHAWRKRRANGSLMIVRFADDFVIGFEHRWEAEQFQRDLKLRLKKFGLELHPDKTRLIEFGRFAASNRAGRGQPKPESFTFLGFTHYCGKDRRGWFKVGRCTAKQRMRRKLKELKAELRRRMHAPAKSTGKWLSRILRGYFNYYAVPGNLKALRAFRSQVTRYWRHLLSRRSQKGKVTWKRMKRYIKLYLPSPRILHPYPSERFFGNTQGRSPVR